MKLVGSHGIVIYWWYIFVSPMEVQLSWVHWENPRLFVGSSTKTCDLQPIAEWWLNVKSLFLATKHDSRPLLCVYIYIRIHIFILFFNDYNHSHVEQRAPNDKSNPRDSIEWGQYHLHVEEHPSTGAWCSWQGLHMGWSADAPAALMKGWTFFDEQNAVLHKPLVISLGSGF